MKENLQSLNIEQLLAEADALIEKINSDAIKDMKDEHLIEFEKQTQNLKNIKSDVQNRTEKSGSGSTGSIAKGTHEAIQDIVKAIHGLQKDLS